MKNFAGPSRRQPRIWQPRLFALPRLLWLLLAAVLVAPITAQQTDPGDTYLSIYTLIQDADSLNAKGQSEAAQAKYQQAQTGLERLHKQFPAWNNRLLSFRLP